MYRWCGRSVALAAIENNAMLVHGMAKTLATRRIPHCICLGGRCVLVWRNCIPAELWLAFVCMSMQMSRCPSHSRTNFVSVSVVSMRDGIGCKTANCLLHKAMHCMIPRIQQRERERDRRHYIPHTAPQRWTTMHHQSLHHEPSCATSQSCCAAKPRHNPQQQKPTDHKYASFRMKYCICGYILT
jgi:hypothetical protein